VGLRQRQAGKGEQGVFGWLPELATGSRPAEAAPAGTMIRTMPLVAAVLAVALVATSSTSTARPSSSATGVRARGR
jgi:hypothetical protein